MTATLLDLIAAQEAREQAVKRVAVNADPEWMTLALATICDLARVRDTMTTDDIWEAMHPHETFTHEPRAMGAAMRRAARNGWIEATPDYRSSARPSCHARPVRVWGSLIREGA